MGKTATLANIGSVADGSLGFRNRIINGAMVIDQRNAGASVATSTSAFCVDRMQVYASVVSKYTAQQNAGSVTPPAGFKNYLGLTSSSAYSSGINDVFALLHNIEGFNVADLGFGAAGASTVTLSFWVRSSLTGLFGGSLANDAYNRSYPFSYTINSANTWEYKTITIAGDTTGTWATTNAAGIRLYLDIGSGSNYKTTAGSWTAGIYTSVTGATSIVGTSGATFYITGVQLEKGSTATAFDYRPYGTELQLCQRYYTKLITGSGSTGAFLVGAVSATTVASRCTATLPVTMRSTPTFQYTNLRLFDGNTAAVVTSTTTNNSSTTDACVDLVASTWSSAVGRACVVIENAANGSCEFNAEL